MVLVTFATNANSQSSKEQSLLAAIETFKKGVVDADATLLNSIAADELVFVHSNGRSQNKAEFVEELVSKKPNDYTKVDITDQKINFVGKTAIVRHTYAADYTADGKPGSLKIGVMLIWQETKGKWKLIARQAYRLA